MARYFIILCISIFAVNTLTSARLTEEESLMEALLRKLTDEYEQELDGKQQEVLEQNNQRKKLDHLHRAFWNLGGMVSLFTDQWATDYADYGCYCGAGNMGEDVPPVDDVDTCCQAHDACFGDFDSECSDDYSSYWSSYNWKYNGEKDATCEDDPKSGKEGRCLRMLCDCDLTFGRCLKTTQYKDKYYNWVKREDGEARCQPAGAAEKRRFHKKQV